MAEPSLVSGGACLSFGDHWWKGQRTGDLGFPMQFSYKHWLVSFIYWSCVSGSLVQAATHPNWKGAVPSAADDSLGLGWFWEILSHSFAAASGCSHKPLKSDVPSRQ